MRSNYKKLGSYIRPVDERNSDGSLGEDNLYGISVTKDFIVTHANLVGVTFDSYKVVAPRQFAYIPDTSRRGDKIAISLNTTGEKIIVSSICTVFEIADEDQLLPEYLMLWFMRPEFDRYARFMSNGSAREVFDWDCMCGVELPVPPLSAQQKIVRDYKVINDRIELLCNTASTVEGIIQTLFEKTFSDAGIQLNEAVMKQTALADEWTSTTIGQMSSVQTGPFGSQLHNEDYVSEGTPIITVEHLDGKYIAHRNLPLVSDEDRNRLDKYSLRTGDIVFSRVGSVDRAVIISTYEDGWLFSGRCLRVRPKNPQEGIYYLWWFSQPVIKQLVIASAVGTTMPSINTTILSDIRLILPPQKELTEFCNQANSLIRIVWASNAETRALEQMQQMMMSKMACGW